VKMALDWLIIANGERISPLYLETLAVNKQIMVLDGAMDEMLCDLLEPHVVLGDFDSISTDLMNRKKALSECIFVHAPDQNASDLEKALSFVLEYQPRSIVICQATGLRLDHTLYNLRLLKRFHGKCAQLSLVTEIEKIVFLKDESVSLSVKDKQPLALMAFPKAVVTSSGLEYDMDRYLLAFAESESTSNSIVASEAVIDVDGEALLIMSHETDNKRLYV